MEEAGDTVSQFEAFASCIARIFYKDRNDGVAGGGFLVAPCYLLTCAHVVAEALGHKQKTKDNLLNQLLKFEFRRDLPDRFFQGTVVFWRSFQDGDIALLRVLEPLPGTVRSAIQPTVFSMEPLENGKRCRAFGWRMDEGAWAEGYELCGWRRPGKIAQYEQRYPGSYAIEAGFSGCPIWAEGSNALLGMISTAHLEEGKDGATFAIAHNVLRDVLDVRRLLDILEPHQEALTKNIDAAYKFCRPDDSLPEHHPQTLMEKLDFLYDRLPIAKLPGTCIDQFAAFFQQEDFLTQSIPVDVWTRLTEWGESRSVDFAELRRLIQQQRPAAEPATSQGEFYLLVVVEPVQAPDAKKALYRVKGWTIPNGDRYDPETGKGSDRISLQQGEEKDVSEESITVDAIPQRIYDFLEAGAVPVQKANIEVFVPRELFAEAIEFWEFEDEVCFEPSYFCIDYKIWIRSYERTTLKYKRYLDHWQDRWKRLEKHQHSRACDGFVPIEPGKANTLKSSISNLQPERSLGVKFTSAMQQVERDSVYNALLATAMPAAVLLRRSLPDVEFSREIDRILDCPVRDLPDRIHAERQSALARRAENPDDWDCAGRYLSLIWDNPLRLPPKKDFTEASL